MTKRLLQVVKARSVADGIHERVIKEKIYAPAILFGGIASTIIFFIALNICAVPYDIIILLRTNLFGKIIL